MIIHIRSLQLCARTVRVSYFSIDSTGESIRCIDCHYRLVLSEYLTVLAALSEHSVK